MASSPFQQFLSESTAPAPATGEPLPADGLYGLYVSWAFLHRITPHPEAAFHSAMRRHGVNPRARTLSMTGPAAVDYILNSYPGVA